jgi:hypothetical protein
VLPYRLGTLRPAPLVDVSHPSQWPSDTVVDPAIEREIADVWGPGLIAEIQKRLPSKIRRHERADLFSLAKKINEARPGYRRRSGDARSPRLGPDRPHLG